MRGHACGAAAAALAVLLAATACGGSDPAPRAPAPRLGAEVVQLRRDEVLARVEVAVTNHAAELVTVESIDLRVPGLGGAGPQAEAEPLPPGQTVDLPTAYGAVRCTADGRPSVGRPTVVVRVHTAADPASRRLVLRPRDTGRVLERLAARECLARRLRSEVALTFAPTWRRTGTGADVAVHGTLRARLRTDQPRDVTQLAGTVIFDLAPDGRRRPDGAPLARLTPARPAAAVPVVVSLARCDGHARGETKQPYAFLVWIGAPGTDGQAVTPAVSAADRAAFRVVCPF